MVWVATPKNAVERISCILVIERKSSTARYYCLKCNTTFLGSKKRIIEHLRAEGGDGKYARNCTVPITPEEEAICLEDEEQDPGGASREAGADGEGIKEGSRKRKKPAELESRNPDCESPFPGDEPAPEPEGWRKVKDPRFNDDRLIWVGLAKNEIERMPCVYVVERRATTSRYLCTKCNFMYWGSKKRVKEHLRDQAGDVKGCTVRITPEEEDILQKDDAVARVRTSRASRASVRDGLLDKAVEKGRVHNTCMEMLNLNTQEDARATEGNGSRLRVASPQNSIHSIRSTQSTQSTGEDGRMTEGNGDRLGAASNGDRLGAASRRHFSATGIGTRPLNVPRAVAAVRLGKSDEGSGSGGEGRGAVTRHTRRQQTCEMQLEAGSEASSSSTKLMSSHGLALQPPAASDSALAAAGLTDADAVQAASANSIVGSDGGARREEGGLQDASNGSGGIGCQGDDGKDWGSERSLPRFSLTPSLPPSLPSPTGSSNKRPAESFSCTSKSGGTSNGGQVLRHTDAASASHPLLNDE